MENVIIERAGHPAPTRRPGLRPWRQADAGGIGVLNTAQGPPRLQPAATLHNPDHTGAGSEPVEVDPEGGVEPEYEAQGRIATGGYDADILRCLAILIGGEQIRLIQACYELDSGIVVVEPRSNPPWPELLFGTNIGALEFFSTDTPGTSGERYRISIDDDRDAFAVANAYVEELLRWFGSGRGTAGITRVFGVFDVIDHPVYGRITSAELDVLRISSWRQSWRNSQREAGRVIEAYLAAVTIVLTPVDIVVALGDVAEGRVLAAAIRALPAGLDWLAARFIRRNPAAGAAIEETLARASAPTLRVLQRILREPDRIQMMRKAREALDSGELDRAEWVAGIRRGAFRQDSDYSRAVAVAAKLQPDYPTFTRPNLRPNHEDLQHDRPLQFEEQFLSAGLDPNDPRFTRWLDVPTHRSLHAGHASGVRYNEYWKGFFVHFTERNPATARDVLEWLEHAPAFGFP